MSRSLMVVAVLAAVGTSVGLQPLATCALAVGAGAWAAGVSLPVLTGRRERP